MKPDDAACGRYAHALFQAARKAGELEAAGRDLESLATVFESSGLKRFLESPKYAMSEKRRVIDRMAAKLASRLTAQTLNLLVRKNRINLLYGIQTQFDALWKEAQGVVPAEIVLSEKPEAALVDSIESALTKKTGKKTEMTIRTDPDIGGGIMIKIKNRLIDGSVRNRLHQLKQKLLETRLP